MISIQILALVLIMETLLEKLLQRLFLFQPVHFKLTDGKSYHAFTAKERVTRFNHLRQTVFMAKGILLLIILTGKEIFDGGNWLQKVFFLGSLICILIPLCEMAYYRWSTGRHYKPGMTAKEMSAYHDFCERYNIHTYSLNGQFRQKARFFIFSSGVAMLIFLSILI